MGQINETIRSYQNFQKYFSLPIAFQLYIRIFTLMETKSIFQHYDRRMQVIVGIALGLCANVIGFACYFLSTLTINIFEL